jgi:hypothetical protein
MKRLVPSEKKLVIVLFVIVLVVFSFAQEDSKKIEKLYLDNSPGFTSQTDAGNQIGLKEGKNLPEPGLR